MIKVFVPSELSFEEIKNIITDIEAAKIVPDATQIGGKFDEMIATMSAGDTIVVHSLDFMASLTDLLTTVAHLDDREITLKSIKEPWIDDELTDTRDLFDRLSELAQSMHSTRTLAGLKKARAKGKKLGRKPRTKELSREEDMRKIAAIDRLRAQKNLSISAACSKIGYPRYAYYAKREVKN